MHEYEENEEDEDETVYNDYENVSNKIYRVGDIIDGIYKAVPVVFNAPFVSILSTSVFWCIENLELTNKSRMKKVTVVI